MIGQLHESLRRLQTDYIDLYWLHGWDRNAPIEQTLRALDDVVTAGKVRYIALSDVPAWVAAQAQTIAGFRGWAPITALQLEYSLLERTSDGELHDWPVIDAVAQVATELGVTSAQVALAWVVGRPGIGSTLIGARTIEQLHANLASLDVTLTPEQRATLDEVSAPTLDFPAPVVNTSAAVAFGGMTVDGTAYPVFATNGKQRRGEY
jgi:aryl-alcohol dehydrogenase-like predicted oxidoreductase